MMTVGDVAKIHQIFNWAKKPNKDATHTSEAKWSALNALPFRAGDQSRDIVLVLAMNRPGDLDSATTGCVDEVIEFPLPAEEERFKLLKLYFNKHFSGEGESSTPKLGQLLSKKTPQKLTIKEDLSDDVIQETARKTEGFSGREIAKLIAGVHAAV